MNEIEEYLLMLFLEKRNSLDLYCRLYDVNHPLTVRELDELDNIGDDWLTFRQEELGRTLPEEFEFHISKQALEWLRKGESIGISLENKRYENTPVKIKITVVEND